MSKPKSKAECLWYGSLCELTYICHKTSTKKWIKQKLNRARRRVAKNELQRVRKDSSYDLLVCYA